MGFFVLIELYLKSKILVSNVLNFCLRNKTYSDEHIILLDSIFQDDIDIISWVLPHNVPQLLSWTKQILFNSNFHVFVSI